MLKPPKDLLKLYTQKKNNDEEIINKIRIINDTLKNAWSIPIKSVIVTNDNNLYLDKIDNINDEELPNSEMLDGVINCIDFKINDKWYNFEINNLGYYSEEDIDENEYLSLMTELLIELDDELESQVQDVENYFVLDDEEE